MVKRKIIKKNLTWGFATRQKDRKSIIREMVCGYTQTEISKTIQIMLAMTSEELNLILCSPLANVFEVSIARALCDCAHGDNMTAKIRNLEILLTRVFGRPKETVELVEKPIRACKLTRDQKLDVLQASRAYQEMMK